MSPISSLNLLESTFPGWPEFTPPTSMFMFMLMFGAPLLIALVVGGLIVATSRKSDAIANQRIAGLIDEEEQKVAAVAPVRAQRALDADAV
ncbi:hypothetical protein ACTQ49_02430 [Luteococcus sp. Sow4_B9]|uniref:hypothetical protein n=1 Tax=Luteococcus sp. Sow4_B9 TaxID=3438792 RepID=UPI003F9B8E98